MLRLKLLRSFILSSSPFKYISSCIKCSRWHPGTERNWSLLVTPGKAQGCCAGSSCPAHSSWSSPWDLWALGWAGGAGGHLQMGREVTSGISWLVLLWEGKSFFIFNLEFICSEFIALQLLEGRISCFVLFLYSVSLILVCPFVFWKWKKAEET